MATTCHSLPSAHTKTVDLEEISRLNEKDSDADDSDSNSVDPLLLRGSYPQQEYGSANVNVEATSALSHKVEGPRNNLRCRFLEWLCLSLCLTLTAAFFITPLMFQYLYAVSPLNVEHTTPLLVN